MNNPIDHYWQTRLMNVKKALEKNNFEVYVTQTAAEAKDLIVNTLVLKAAPTTVSWGGSMTLGAVGIADAMKANPSFTVINPYEPSLPPAEAYERRRQSLLVDLFFAGTNALTEDGHLVNLDGVGNRVGGINFGPKNVIVVIGRNKLVLDVERAMERIKTIAAPINAMRLDRKTPCALTSFCQDCDSPDRICNVWTITEKSFPKGRIKVVLINQDMGF